jgi:hypothetical protein
MERVCLCGESPHRELAPVGKLRTSEWQISGLKPISLILFDIGHDKTEDVEEGFCKGICIDFDLLATRRATVADQGINAGDLLVGVIHTLEFKEGECHDRSKEDRKF